MIVPLVGGVAVLVVLPALRVRARATRCCRCGLFRRRNFSAGNIETFAMYAGLAIVFFFLVLFLQQIGGYTPLQSGLATLPVTIVMFLLSRRFGALADRYGPRLLHGRGAARRAPSACCCSRRTGTHVDYLPEVLPAAAAVLARARR